MYWFYPCHQDKKGVVFSVAIMKKKKIKLKNELPDRKEIVKQLDNLWRVLINNRDEKCVKCGKLTKLQAAHIFSRRNCGTRWLPENGLLLCVGCHLFWAHKEPIEFAEFVRQRLGEKEYELLRMKATKPTKFTVSELVILSKELRKIIDKGVKNIETTW